MDATRSWDASLAAMGEGRGEMGDGNAATRAAGARERFGGVAEETGAETNRPARWGRCLEARSMSCASGPPLQPWARQSHRPPLGRSVGGEESVALVIH